MRKQHRLLALAAACALVPACGGGSGGDDPPAQSAPEIALVTLSGTTLNVYSARAPGVLLYSLPITGTTGTLVGIDYRPANGQLYALSDNETLYSVSTVNGAATAVGPAFGTALNGSSFGVDFNPADDRLRVISDADQNLRVNPGTGGASVDGALNYPAAANPNVVAAAYTTTGVLFGVDTVTDNLVRVTDPFSGALTPVGALGVDVSNAHFDIALDNQGYLAMASQSDGFTRLYAVNLFTGQTLAAGLIGTGTAIQGMAVAALPAFRPGSGSVVALRSNTTGSVLLNFLPGSPNGLNGALTITGVSGTLVGVDYRPASGELLALSDTPRLYRIDVVSGAATALGAGPLPGYSATPSGFDVNPQTDFVRVVNVNDQNRRLDPTAGTEAGADANLAFAAADPNNGDDPQVLAIAHNNNTAGAVASTLFGIDVGNDVLVSSTAPDGGQLTTVGALGVDVNEAHFDIHSGGTFYAAMRSTGDGVTRLYTINGANGAATVLGTLGSGLSIEGMTVKP